ncbi:Protein detoxification 44, chloroplastic [Vitis vinifera]|uniref:Protein detoxification 44, chloroplastic n=1 Tax=Vitis vinifera TaxID=29760 RepID=A0A438FTA4_VITVI|nr:Protein detoxification 44, chloroplastic [Vitis vinifera]
MGAGNLLNAILDPILIFLLGLGIGGAAISTVISEYLIAFVLLWELNDKVFLISPNIDGMRIAQYLKSGGLLIGRTLAVLATMTLATSMAAKEGPIPMAGHQICLQVWLAISLLTDALALSGQCILGFSIVEALLASGYSQGNYEEAQQVIYKVLEMGLATGIALAVILFLGFGAFASLFTTDLEVLGLPGLAVLVGCLRMALTVQISGLSHPKKSDYTQLWKSVKLDGPAFLAQFTFQDRHRMA